MRLVSGTGSEKLVTAWLQFIHRKQYAVWFQCGLCRTERCGYRQPVIFEPVWNCMAHCTHKLSLVVISNSCLIQARVVLIQHNMAHRSEN